MNLLPYSVVLLSVAWPWGAVRPEVGASVGDPNGDQARPVPEGEMGKAPGTGSDASGGDSGTDEGNSGGYPCDEEGARFREIDTAYECQDGQWVFASKIARHLLTCETTTGTCVEKVCDRGERRCIDGETVQFCKPDQTDVE